MATRETRQMRGRRRGRMLVARTLAELQAARVAAGLSLRQMASERGQSKSALSRMLGDELADVGVVELSELASVLGFEISLGLHPVGDAVRDRAQLAIGRRFDGLLAQAWRVTDETLLPGQAELRAWDKLLRLVGAQPRHLVGVDLESRVRDIQALVRRTRLRERDGQVDAILLVLADTAHNRRLAPELRTGLGASYATAPRALLHGLRAGARLAGSGLVLV